MEWKTIVEKLGLEPHPEGGFYRSTWRSEETLEYPDGLRHFGTGIYYLLVGTAFSAFHRLPYDEIWHHYSGAEVVIHCLDLEFGYRMVFLGQLGDNRKPQVVIKKGCWFSAEIVGRSGYALMGCTMAPGFHFNDLEFGDKDYLTERFPQERDLIFRLCRQKQ